VPGQGLLDDKVDGTDFVAERQPYLARGAAEAAVAIAVAIDRFGEKMSAAPQVVGGVVGPRRRRSVRLGYAE
jgi:hypothetical protein